MSDPTFQPPALLERSDGAQAHTPAPRASDRSGALVAIGVLEIILGGICGLMMVFTAVMFAVMPSLPHAPGAPPPALSMRTDAPSISFYGLVAVSFIFLGIGATRARRWARRINIILSSLWLLGGVLALAMVFFVLGAVFDAMPQHGAAPPAMVKGIMMTVMVVVISIFMIAMPLALLLFFRSPSVAATCEAKSPPDWTDRAPLPVLGLSVVLAHGAYFFLAMSWSMSPFGFFGHFAVGAEALVLNLVLTAVWGVLALEVYRLRMRGWWGTVGATVAITISQVDTLLSVSPEAYRVAMGLPATSPMPIGMTSLAVMVGAWVVPFLGYIVWTRKYFRR